MSKELKYELIEVEPIDGLRYRVKALKDFGDVKKGDIGGYVNSEDNLSQDGDCWVYGNSRLHDNSRIYDNASMHDNSEMYGNSIMYDNSRLRNAAKMYADSRLHDNSFISNNGKIFNTSEMWDNTKMYNSSELRDNGRMYGHSNMTGESIIRGNSILFNYARTYGEFDGRDVYLHSGYLYEYTARVVYDKLEPTHIELGCYKKTPEEWRKEFWNNEDEFPKGSDEAKLRLMALNSCLREMGEEIIKMEDIL